MLLTKTKEEASWFAFNIYSFMKHIISEYNKRLCVFYLLDSMFHALILILISGKRNHLRICQENHPLLSILNSILITHLTVIQQLRFAKQKNQVTTTKERVNILKSSFS